MRWRTTGGRGEEKGVECDSSNFNTMLMLHFTIWSGKVLHMEGSADESLHYALEIYCLVFTTEKFYSF
jgi:hypothetical protein